MLEPTEFVSRWRANGLAGVDPKFAAQWGSDDSDDLVSFDPNTVNSLAIPETSKRFLVEAGLPVKANTNYNFAVGNVTLLTVPEVLPILESAEDYLRYRILGFRGFDAPPWETTSFIILDFICLDEQSNGRVVVVENSPEMTVTYLNGSVEQLAEFFLVLRNSREYSRVHKPKTEEEIEAFGQMVLQQLHKIDPEAVQKEMGWYNPTILDLELGL